MTFKGEKLGVESKCQRTEKCSFIWWRFVSIQFAPGSNTLFLSWVIYSRAMVYGSAPQSRHTRWRRGICPDNECKGFVFQAADTEIESLDRKCLQTRRRFLKLNPHASQFLTIPENHEIWRFPEVNSESWCPDPLNTPSGSRGRFCTPARIWISTFKKDRSPIFQTRFCSKEAQEADYRCFLGLYGKDSRRAQKCRKKKWFWEMNFRTF